MQRISTKSNMNKNTWSVVFSFLNRNDWVQFHQVNKELFDISFGPIPLKVFDNNQLHSFLHTPYRGRAPLIEEINRFNSSHFGPILNGYETMDEIKQAVDVVRDNRSAIAKRKAKSQGIDSAFGDDCLRSECYCGFICFSVVFPGVGGGIVGGSIGALAGIALSLTVCNGAFIPFLASGISCGSISWCAGRIAPRICEAKKAAERIKPQIESDILRETDIFHYRINKNLFYSNFHSAAREAVVMELNNRKIKEALTNRGNI